MVTFVRVAESGSFTAAASQLGVSVSAVAKAVSRLEENLASLKEVRKATVLNTSALTPAWAARLGAGSIRIVFLDPPYKLGIIASALLYNEVASVTK